MTGDNASEYQNPWRCSNCGSPVARWYHGWQHQRGWRSRPNVSACKGKPKRVENLATGQVLDVNRKDT